MREIGAEILEDIILKEKHKKIYINNSRKI